MFTEPTRPAEPQQAHFDCDAAKRINPMEGGKNLHMHYAIHEGTYAITPNPLLGPYADPITPSEWEQLVSACKALNYDWDKIARAWFQLGRYMHNRAKRTGQTWIIDKIYYTENVHRAAGAGWLRARIIAPPHMNDILALTDNSGALLPNDPPSAFLEPSGAEAKPERKCIWWRHYTGEGHWEVS